MLKASRKSLQPAIPTAFAVLLVTICCSIAAADRTVDVLIAAMRFNDGLLQECVLEGSVVNKILPPPPPPPHILEVVVKGGQDISKLPGVDKIPELMLEYGTASGIPLAEVPADYVPLVQLIRDKKIFLKTVKDDRPKRITHFNYRYVLAQLRGDVALQLYGGDRNKDALKIAFIAKSNLNSTLEYFAGTWERREWTSAHSVSVFHEKALWYCFSLGVGFGERVQSATLQSKRGEQYVLDAKISIWPGQTHDAQLVVDGDGLVREAIIDCVYNHIRCESSGVHMIPGTGTRIASQGRIEVASPGGIEFDNFSVVLKDVEPRLSEADFATLSDLSVTDEYPVYYWKDGNKSAPELMGGTDRPQ